MPRSSLKTTNARSSITRRRIVSYSTQPRIGRQTTVRGIPRAARGSQRASRAGPVRPMFTERDNNDNDFFNSRTTTHCSSAYDKLLSCSGNHQITLHRTSHGTGFLVDGTRFVKGVTRLIEAAYPPPPPPKGMQEHADCMCKGVTPIEHGTIVDREWNTLVNVFNGDWNAFRDSLARAFSVADPCTRRLHDFIKQQGWRPLQAQFNIHSQSHGFGTAIDFLCEKLLPNGRKNLIVCELKVSWHDTKRSYEYPHGRFYSRPFSGIDFPRSYKNFHMLQLLATYLCLTRSYKVTPDECYLIRVGSTDIWKYPLPDLLKTQKVLTEFGARLAQMSRFTRAPVYR